MQFERTKNSARNFIFGSISRIVTVLFPFITRTLIIYRLGAEYAGLGGLFNSVLAVLSVTELGLGAAVTFCMYKPVAEGKTDEICQLLSLIRKIYKVIGFVILGVGLTLTPFLRYLIHGDCPADINPTVLYLIYLLNSSSSYLLFAYKEVVFSVYQRKDITHKIFIVVELLKYVSQIIILLAVPNYYLFTLSLLLSTLLNSILIGIYSRKMFPALEPKGYPSKEYTSVIKNKVKYLAANLISSTLVNSADNIVISAGIGLTMVTVYGNYQYISSSVLGFILIAYTSMTPAFGNAVIVESKEKIYSIFKTLWAGVTWLAIWCTVCLLCLYQPFITLWVGDEYMLPMGVVILIVLFFFANTCTQFFSTTCIHATGLWNKTMGFRIAASLVNLILNIVLVKKYGVGGIVFASLAAYLLISLPLHIYVTYKYILDRKPVLGFLSMLGKIGLLVVFGALTYFLCGLIPGTGIYSFIGKMLICIFVPNGIYFAFTYKTEEFIAMKGYVRSLIKRS